MQGFRFVTLGLSKTYKNCINIPANFIRFPNLLNACDAAISKPGYGLVAEIIANQTPLLYTSRTDFVEYEVLVQGLKEYAVAKELPREVFFAGSWQQPLEALLQQTSDWKRIELNGAEEAADEILKLIPG
jgi:predicted glycosyltransferase